jgi:hypothetical protein
MKKNVYAILVMLLTAALPALFTACDWTDDEDIAYTLEGTWRGDMRIYSDYRGVRYYATDTEITFLRDPRRYSSGDGYWVDYYSDAPWDYVANHISWTVNFGDIDVYLREERTSITIRNYRLSDNRFVGTLYDGGNRVDFRLYYVSSPNWNRYDRWGYDGWYDRYYYSRPTRSTEPAATGSGKPVRGIGE